MYILYAYDLVFLKPINTFLGLKIRAYWWEMVTLKVFRRDYALLNLFLTFNFNVNTVWCV